MNGKKIYKAPIGYYGSLLGIMTITEDELKVAMEMKKKVSFRNVSSVCYANTAIQMLLNEPILLCYLAKLHETNYFSKLVYE